MGSMIFYACVKTHVLPTEHVCVVKCLLDDTGKIPRWFITYRTRGSGYSGKEYVSKVLIFNQSVLQK